MTYQSWIQTITLASALLFSSISPAEAPASKNPLDGGLSVSMRISVSNMGKAQFDGFVFDPNFQIKTKGFVGRDGKKGNVALARLAGINVTTSGNGTLTLSKNIENEVDRTHIESLDKRTGVVNQTISFGSASPAEFPQVHPYKGLYGTTGLWMNQKGGCSDCMIAVSTGMFIDGAPTAVNKSIRTLESTKGIEIFPTFKGALDGMPPGDCDADGECEWGLKATVTTEPDIHKGIQLKTNNTFIHYHHQGTTKITPRPDLNITGTLTFDSERNLFTGKIKDGRGVTGTAMGRYYGPAHNEIGIVYALGSPTEASTEMGSIYAVRFGGIN